MYTACCGNAAAVGTNRSVIADALVGTVSPNGSCAATARAKAEASPAERRRQLWEAQPSGVGESLCHVEPLGHAITSTHACDGLQNACNARTRGHLEHAHELRAVGEARRHAHGLDRCIVLLGAGPLIRLDAHIGARKSAGR